MNKTKFKKTKWEIREKRKLKVNNKRAKKKKREEKLKCPFCQIYNYLKTESIYWIYLFKKKKKDFSFLFLCY